MKKFVLGIACAITIAHTAHQYAMSPDKELKIHVSQKKQLEDVVPLISNFPGELWQGIIIPYLGSAALPATLFPISLKPVSKLKHEDQVTSATFNKSGNTLVTTTQDTLRIWDTQTNKLIHKSANAPDAMAKALAGARSSKYIATKLHNTVRIAYGQGTQKNELHRELFHPDQVLDAQFDAAGDQLITTCEDGVVRIWDPHSGKLLQESRLYLKSAKFDPKGNVVGTKKNGARLISAFTGRAIFNMAHDEHLNGIDIDSSGDRVVTASNDSTACVWDISGYERFCGDAQLNQQQLCFLWAAEYYWQKNGNKPMSLKSIAKKEGIPLQQLQNAFSSFSPKEQAWLYERYVKSARWL